MNGQKHLKDRVCNPEEVTALYIKAGWIGELRVPHPILKLIPFFDRGPGPDVGR